MFPFAYGNLSALFVEERRGQGSKIVSLWMDDSFGWFNLR